MGGSLASFPESDMVGYNASSVLNDSMNVIITADRLYTPLEQIEWPVVFITTE